VEKKAAPARDAALLEIFPSPRHSGATRLPLLRFSSLEPMAIADNELIGSGSPPTRCLSNERVPGPL